MVKFLHHLPLPSDPARLLNAFIFIAGGSEKGISEEDKKEVRITFDHLREFHG
jgi:hypothetical protein